MRGYKSLWDFGQVSSWLRSCAAIISSITTWCTVSIFKGGGGGGGCGGRRRRDKSFENSLTLLYAQAHTTSLEEREREQLDECEQSGKGSRNRTGNRRSHLFMADQESQRLHKFTAAAAATTICSRSSIFQQCVTFCSVRSSSLL